jgi:hypothetical protein
MNNSEGYCIISGDPLSETPHIILNPDFPDMNTYCINDLLDTIGTLNENIESGGSSLEYFNSTQWNAASKRWIDIQKPYFSPRKLKYIKQMPDEQWQNLGIRTWSNYDFTHEEKARIASFIAENHEKRTKPMYYFFQTNDDDERAIYSTESPIPISNLIHTRFMNKFGYKKGLRGLSNVPLQRNLRQQTRRTVPVKYSVVRPSLGGRRTRRGRRV